MGALETRNAARKITRSAVGDVPTITVDDLVFRDCPVDGGNTIYAVQRARTPPLLKLVYRTHKGEYDDAKLLSWYNESYDDIVRMYWSRTVAYDDAKMAYTDGESCYILGKHRRVKTWGENYACLLDANEPLPEPAHVHGHTVRPPYCTLDPSATRHRVLMVPRGDPARRKDTALLRRDAVRRMCAQLLQSQVNSALRQRAEAVHDLARGKLYTWNIDSGIESGTVGASVACRDDAWGVCRPHERHITYAARLAAHPPEVIQYVVLHELAHLREPNHGFVFWLWVKKHMEDYEAHKHTISMYPYGCSL